MADEIVRALERGSPAVQYEYVDVRFPSVAGDVIAVPYKLDTPNPNDVAYVVVDWRFTAAPASAPVVYRRIDSARQATSQTLYLRCTVASATCTLLLMVKR